MYQRKLIILFSFLFFLSTLFVFTPKVFAETHISGSIDGNVTWNLANSPYVIDNYSYISSGSSLSIEGGVIVKFAPYAEIDMSNGGFFNALGSADNKIYFTSLADDSVGGDTNGDGSASVPDISDTSQNIWYGIIVSNGFNPSPNHISLQNVVVRYSDIGLSICGVLDVSIKDSVFEKNRKGIYDYGNSHVIISNTKIINNNIGIHLNQEDYSPGSVYQTNGLSIYNNSDYGVLNDMRSPVPCYNWQKPLLWLANLFQPEKAFADEDTYTIDFKNTWWGDASGPMHFSNPDGSGDKVSDNVLFDPWLTSDPLGKSKCCSSVLFLPGIEASRLYKQKTILGIPAEDQLWEPHSRTQVTSLYLNSDGTSQDPNIYTKDIINEANMPMSLGLPAQDVYKSFTEMMDKLVSDKKIGEWKPFAYDWRQSVDDIVTNGTKYQTGIVSLVDTLQSLVDSSKNKNGKVTIIAHSNGGLLAKALLKKLQDDKIAERNNLINSVDVLILVASPEIGTASAVPAILHGYDQSMLWGLLVDEVNARELGRNMPGAYGLLPSKEYINRVSASPATFVDDAIPSNITTKLVQTFGSAISSYAEYKDFLFGAEGRIDPLVDEPNLPISLSPDLFSKAEILHHSIDAWIPPTGMRVIEVAGWGLDTVASFEYYPKACTQSLGCGFILDERPRFTSDGDNTVVVPSAQYMSSVNSNVEKYWVNLFQMNNDKFPLDANITHGNIFEVDSLLSFISNTIQELPLENSAYLSTTVPVDTSNHFHISIHSPVTLDAYNAGGNHTGEICLSDSDFCYAEENIPNSSYLEFGEGKYINLPEDQMSKVKLQGTDIGTFTYDSEKVLPDGTSTTFSFVDIPVTTQTQAEITLNQSTGTPQLALDVTGDGVTDFTIIPNTTFDPILFLQIMKKTVESFDISKQQKNMLTKRIDDTIKAIQKGKINKAKLKIEQFKKALTIHPKENEKDRQGRERKNEREHEKEHKENKKPKQLAPADAQTLITLLNQLLDNLN